MLQTATALLEPAQGAQPSCFIRKRTQQHPRSTERGCSASPNAERKDTMAEVRSAARCSDCSQMRVRGGCVLMYACRRCLVEHCCVCSYVGLLSVLCVLCSLTLSHGLHMTHGSLATWHTMIARYYKDATLVRDCVGTQAAFNGRTVAEVQQPGCRDSNALPRWGCRLGLQMQSHLVQL